MDGWWDYVVRIAGTSEQNMIAKNSGIGTTVISRWFKGHNEPSAKFVVQFARAHRRPPVEALVAAGYLTESDAAEVIEVHRGIRKIDDDELLAEIRRRMKGARHAVADETQSPAQAQSHKNEEGDRPTLGLAARIVDDEKPK